jgi:hypothetical protein
MRWEWDDYTDGQLPSITYMPISSLGTRFCVDNLNNSWYFSTKTEHKNLKAYFKYCSFWPIPPIITLCQKPTKYLWWHGHYWTKLVNAAHKDRLLKFYIQLGHPQKSNLDKVYQIILDFEIIITIFWTLKNWSN